MLGLPPRYDPIRPSLSHSGCLITLPSGDGGSKERILPWCEMFWWKDPFPHPPLVKFPPLPQALQTPGNSPAPTLVSVVRKQNLWACLEQVLRWPVSRCQEEAALVPKWLLRWLPHSVHLCHPIHLPRLHYQRDHLWWASGRCHWQLSGVCKLETWVQISEKSVATRWW